MPSRQALGAWGEGLAAAHLQHHGFTIEARNWRCTLGEIDLVAREATTLAFVEVRTRRSTSFGSPEESLNSAKRRRLVALAYTYLAHHQHPPATPWRIDLVAITVGSNGRVARLHHLRNAIEEQ